MPGDARLVPKPQARTISTCDSGGSYIGLRLGGAAFAAAAANAVCGAPGSLGTEAKEKKGGGGLD